MKTYAPSQGAVLRQADFRQGSAERGYPNSAPMRDDSVGFAVLVFDRWALETGQIGLFLDYLDIRGLNPIAGRILTAAEADALLRVMGTDVRHPSFDPAVLVPVLDLVPTQPTRAELRSFPGVDNRRLARLAKRLQNKMISTASARGGRPFLHFSPNGPRAWQYLSSVMPEHVGSIRDRVSEWREAFTTPFPVIRAFPGRNERAKVELVEFEGRSAVCKTFRPGKEHVLRCELEAIVSLRKTMEEVPEVLASGANWMVTPLYQHVQKRGLGGVLLPLDRARRIVDAVERIHQAGYAHLDLHSDNMIFDEQAGLKIIDWESARRNPDQHVSFEESDDIVGLSAFRSDGGGAVLRRYQGYPWDHEIGLSLKSLRGDADWKQHVKRTIYIALHLIPRRAKEALNRNVRDRLRYHLRK